MIAKCLNALQQTSELDHSSVWRVRDLPDDDTWLTDRRRAIGDRVRAERQSAGTSLRTKCG
jgi:hypothetical protein